MPAPLRVRLTPEEDETLRELAVANSVPRRTRQRANSLRLLAQGAKVEEIAKYLDCAPGTVRGAYHRWQEQGLRGLWDQPRPGRRRRWDEEDWQYLKSQVEQPRRYSAAQLREKLAKERQVHIGTEQVRRILKKKGMTGKGREQCQQQQQTRS